MRRQMANVKVGDGELVGDVVGVGGQDRRLFKQRDANATHAAISSQKENATRLVQTATKLNQTTTKHYQTQHN